MKQQQMTLENNKVKEYNCDIYTTWGKPPYNKVKGDRQRIETHRGCPNNCPYCFEPTEVEVYPIPNLERNYVEILDMNFLYQPEIIKRIGELAEKRVGGRVVYYEEVCGFDHRLMTQEIANELKKARFVRPRIAWDGGATDQFKIKDCIDKLMKAGYKRKEIMCFMIVNWNITKRVCDRKLDLLKIWNVKVCDCCFDGGYKHAAPKRWTFDELKEFRAKCRKHNQIVNFGIDPELKESSP